MDTSDKFDLAISKTLNKVIDGETIRVPHKGGIVKVDWEFFSERLLIGQTELEGLIRDRLDDIDDRLYDSLCKELGI